MPELEEVEKAVGVIQEKLLTDSVQENHAITAAGHKLIRFVPKPRLIRF